MKSQNLVLAGVGGQGILSMAAVICRSAVRSGFHVRQSEVHGMAQRGGAVVSHVRLSEGTIYSSLIPMGTADLLVGLELMEGLRYLPYLKGDGLLVVNRVTVKNLTGYPPEEALLNRIREWPRHVVLDAEEVARSAGSVRTVNSVLIGAISDHLVVSAEVVKEEIRRFFAPRGQEWVERNLKAFDMGRQLAKMTLASL